MVTSKPWWGYFQLSELCNTSTISPHLIDGALELKALDDGLTSYQASIYGHMADLSGIEAILNRIKELGGTCFKKEISENPTSEAEESVWKWDNGYVGIGCGKNSSINVNIAHFDRAVTKSIYDLVKSLLVQKKGGQGKAYMLGSSTRGLELMSVGKAGIAFVPENYVDTVAIDYQHVVADLKSNDPCGKLVIFNGEPGCGKTFAVRSLMSSVDEGVFVVIPSHMIPSIGDPSLLPLLLKTKKSNPNCPLIIVAEDADQVLSSRATDNIAGISTLLNLGAGILGDMIDVRIIATTNISVKEVDNAVVRDGRLCRRIEIGSLNKEHANKIYTRLTGKDGVFTNKNDRYTLANIYKAAKDGGWVPPKKERVAGFATSGFDIANEEDYESFTGLQPVEGEGDVCVDLYVAESEDEFENQLDDDLGPEQNLEDMLHEQGVDPDIINSIKEFADALAKGGID